ncbi:MAG: mercury(II) reductase [Candidatus Velthaea sp.]
MVTGAGDLGGTCILRGCMPAKTLLSSTERLGEVEKGVDLGIDAGDVHVDLPAIIKRKRDLIEYFREDRVHELESYPLVRGAARFTGSNTIDVDGRQIEARKFVIATGSHIVAPAIPGFVGSGYITSDDVLEMKRVPASVAVVGGGPVGCEFAQYFRRLGARVTLLQNDDELLRKEDRDIGAAVRGVLTHEGVDVVLAADIRAVTRAGDECVVTYSAGTLAQSVRVQTILLASGRVPNFDGLDLGAAGILAGETGLAIDPFLRTTNRDVYAAGDVLGRRCLVHTAAYTGGLAARNAFAEHGEEVNFTRYEMHAVYTKPQVAVAGLTERAARELGIPVRVKRHPFSDIGKALVSDSAEGFVKMLATEDGRIVGVSIFGDDAIDLIGEAVVAIDRGVTVKELAAMPHLHPAMGEIFARVAEDLIPQTEAAAV